MDSSKTEIAKAQAKSPPKRTSRLRKLAYWLFVDVCVAVLVIGLLLHRPGRYRPLASAPYEPGQVHRYWQTLGSQFYNATQERRPFELIVQQGPINEAVAQADWPQESHGVMLYSPAVVFEPGRVILMGTVEAEGLKLIAAVEIAPQIDPNGLLALDVAKFKVGAVNITPLARMMGKKMYLDRVTAGGVDLNDIRTMIVAALLNSEKFDPVYKAEDKKARLTNVEVEFRRLTLEFQPEG